MSRRSLAPLLMLSVLACDKRPNPTTAEPSSTVASAAPSTPPLPASETDL